MPGELLRPGERVVSIDFPMGPDNGSGVHRTCYGTEDPAGFHDTAPAWFGVGFAPPSAPTIEGRVPGTRVDGVFADTGGTPDATERFGGTTRLRELADSAVYLP